MKLPWDFPIPADPGPPPVPPTRKNQIRAILNSQRIKAGLPPLLLPVEATVNGGVQPPPQGGLPFTSRPLYARQLKEAPEAGQSNADGA